MLKSSDGCVRPSRKVCDIALGGLAARVPRHRDLLVDPLLEPRARAALREALDAALGVDAERPGNHAPLVERRLCPALDGAGDAKVLPHLR